MDDELVDIVNLKGKVTGQATREETYRKGLLHPAVNIIVLNSKSEIYLQQRSATKKSYPSYWDISASEHLKSGEDFKSAAIRGLLEELSISAPVKLLRPKHIQKSEFVKSGQLIKEYELVELYAAVYNGRITLDKNEVATGRFVGLDKSAAFTKQNFTPWGLDEMQYLQRNKRLLETIK